MTIHQANAIKFEKQSPSKGALVVGVARDCSGTLEVDVIRLLAALRCFKSVWWLIIESDSTDDTLNVLNKLSVTIPKFRFLSLGRLRDIIPLRTERIAHCRNQYLQELRENPLYEEADYDAVADLDGINSAMQSPA